MSIFPIKTLEHVGHHAQAVLFTATEWLHSKQDYVGNTFAEAYTSISCIRFNIFVAGA